MENYDMIESKLNDLQKQVKLMQHLYLTVNLRRDQGIHTIELLEEIKMENEILMSKLTELNNNFLTIVKSPAGARVKHTEVQHFVDNGKCNAFLNIKSRKL